MNSAKSIQTTDDGSWLSAQQAVMPDGTEVGNLPLVNIKLPQLYRPGETDGDTLPNESNAALRAAIHAIEFAVTIEDGLDYLGAWLQGDKAAIRSKWSDAPAS
ncbi:MAG TPA: hypothetical protein VIF60_07145 [Burkholderiaceae bacterium]